MQLYRIVLQNIRTSGYQNIVLHCIAEYQNIVSHRIAEYQDISISEYCIAEYQNIVSHRIAEYQGGGPSSVVGFVARMRREEVLAATS